MTPREIISLIAVEFDSTIEQLRDGTKPQSLLLPRRLAAYLLRYDRQMSFPEIAQLMNRDHTTIIGQVRAVVSQREVHELHLAKLRRMIAARDKPVCECGRPSDGKAVQKIGALRDLAHELLRTLHELETGQ